MVVRERERAVLPQFSTGTILDLQRNHGLVIDILHPRSLAWLRRFRDHKQPLIGHITNQANGQFIRILSLSGQVAIFPEEPYVPESNNLPLNEQILIKQVDFQEVIQSKWGIGGVENHFGNVATHAGISIVYFRDAGVRLHGRDYQSPDCGIPVTSTETCIRDPEFAVVGSWAEGAGFIIDRWDSKKGLPAIWATRLLVPARE